MTLYKAIDACRACGSDQLTQALDLGLFMLSDFRSTADAEPEKAPLTLLRCDDCTLVQLQHTVKRERLYANYWYRSSTQPAMVAALQDVVRDATSRVPIHAGDVVVDIGANDGTLLAQYPEGTIKLAYEPALNLWAPLVESGATVVGGFFPPDQAVAYRKAKVVSSVACFYDVDRVADFVAGVSHILAEDGIWINQLAYLPETLRSNNIGDFVAEHLTFWSVQAIIPLLEANGMRLIDYSFNNVNGGSVRLIIGHGAGSVPANDAPSLLDLKRFSQRTRLNRTAVREFLHTAKRDGLKVVGYAAATKFNTALQYWGLGPELLEVIADRNPDKHGKYTPSGQRVVSEEEMRGMKPDYLLCGAYHFIDAFVEREAELVKQGTEFVVPFPVLQVVGRGHLAATAGGQPESIRGAA